MQKNRKDNLSPRIENRKAHHDYFIEQILECGIALLGSEVKSLRYGKAQINEAFCRVEKGKLVLHNAHIDPYSLGNAHHEPLRERALLVHKRELRKLEVEMKIKGTTLVPLAIYFKDGRAKVEVGVARGKQQFDKRATIKKKEQDREMRRIMTQRR